MVKADHSLDFRYTISGYLPNGNVYYRFIFRIGLSDISINMHFTASQEEESLCCLGYKSHKKMQPFWVVNDLSDPCAQKSLFDNLPLLEYLDVTDNPLSCSCQNAWFKNWSVHSLKVQVPYLYDLHCDNDPLSPYFWEFDDKACSYDYVNFIFFLSTALLDLLFISLGITWHKCRSSIRYLILLLRSRISGRKKGQRNYTYDAFISYSSLDETWVMEQLVPHMEGPNGKGFRLCLHHRDFRPGVAILENIETAIYNSRRTLCVVSRDFLRSEWCTMEFQLASLRLLCDHSDVLLLVFLEEIPDHCLSMYTRLRKLVRKNTYLVWPEAVADQEAFWIRLEDALRGGVEEEAGTFARLLG
ncbi:hypothetical protein JZ751_000727 [Albula glossodonta]|uniref:TIR domain-containing protein n=1 Tax=Albula glossodonta TaxID=121402 RepID=A0A8T2PX17_9TELE|nr:hypothetical protein JZ751_000727 [Albula glossodonta]